MQQFDSTAERSAVHFSGDFTAQLTGIIKEMHHMLLSKIYFVSIVLVSTINHENCFTISFATTSPLIKLGGTPGPGTVNCPV